MNQLLEVLLALLRKKKSFVVDVGSFQNYC